MGARVATSIAILVGTCSVLCLDSRAAWACDESFALDGVVARDHEMLLEGAPANRLFFRELDSPPGAEIDNWMGSPPAFEVDSSWSIRANRNRDAFFEPSIEVFRLVDPEAYVGERLQWECGPTDAEVCSAALGELDVEAPSRPVVSDVDVTIYRTRGETAFGCGNTDIMRFDVEVEDDGTRADDLYLLGYMRDDEDDLAREDQPEIMFSPPHFADGIATVEVPLGDGGTHDRDGRHFRKGQYCFALTAVDDAGNESERSEPVCLDTTDTDDPLVHYGCGCNHRGSSFNFLLLLMVVAARRRPTRETRRLRRHDGLPHTGPSHHRGV